MELTQEIMDIFAAGATEDGVKNWSERSDAAGLRAVLAHIDPVPDGIDEITDGEGGEWKRTDDPLIWRGPGIADFLTARQIITDHGGISWG